MLCHDDDDDVSLSQDVDEPNDKDEVRANVDDVVDVDQS